MSSDELSAAMRSGKMVSLDTSKLTSERLKLESATHATRLRYNLVESLRAPRPRLV